MSEARIETRTIDVFVLRVGERQMTQSVFRQIPYERMDVGADVECWGTVNYFPSNGGHGHVNVLWQKGSELRRCELQIPEEGKLVSGFVTRDDMGCTDEMWNASNEKQRKAWSLIGNRRMDARYREWFDRVIRPLRQLYIAV